jgi:hypothetical protein
MLTRKHKKNKELHSLIRAVVYWRIRYSRINETFIEQNTLRSAHGAFAKNKHLYHFKLSTKYASPLHTYGKACATLGDVTVNETYFKHG